MRRPSKSARRPPQPTNKSRRLSPFIRRRAGWLLVGVGMVGAAIGGVLLAGRFWAPGSHTPGDPERATSLRGAPDPVELPPESPRDPREPPAIPPEPKPVPPEPSGGPPTSNTAGVGSPVGVVASDQFSYSPPTTVKAMAEEEIAVARQLMEDFPNDPDPIGLMGNVYSNHGRNSEALEYWARLVQLDPDRATAYNAMGMLAFLDEEHHKAAELWRKTLRIAPKMPGVHYRLSQALLELGKMEEAIDELRQEVEIAPKACDSYCLLGQVHLQLKDYPKAKENFEVAIRLRPDLTEAYYGLANVFARLKQPDKYREYLQKFREHSAEDAQANRAMRSAYDDLQELRARAAGTYTGAADYYRAHGKVPKAVELWRRAAVLDPKNAVCRERLALQYEQSGKPREALEFWEQRCKMEPQRATCYLKLGALYAGFRQFDDAEQAFAKARQLAPEQASGHRALAQVYLQTNRHVAEALKLARTAVRLDPSAPSYFVLAVACANNGNHSGAVSAMKRAMALDPVNARYKGAYDRLLQRK